MMTARKKILIIGGIFIGVLIVLLLVVLLTNRNRDINAPDNPNISDTTDDTSANGGSTVPAPLPAEPGNVLAERTVAERVGAKQAARIFIEQFGTYSNQNDNEHIALAQALATPSMQQWIVTNNVEQGGAFIGVTTEVLASSIAELTDSDAEILVQVREIRQTQSGVDTSIKNGRVLLTLSSEGIWLVNALYYD